MMSVTTESDNVAFNLVLRLGQELAECPVLKPEIWTLRMD